MNETCPKCGYLIRHHYVFEWMLDGPTMICPESEAA